jgi:hypothetical protein
MQHPVYVVFLVWTIYDLKRLNPRFLAVRERIENTVFTSSSDGKASLRDEVTNAAQNLNDNLLLPGGLGKQTGILWAQAWLQEIGIDEWNPVTCFLLVHEWTNYYIMVVDTLRAFNPVASARS